jgi:hypothetical protein
MQFCNCILYLQTGKVFPQNEKAVSEKLFLLQRTGKCIKCPEEKQVEGLCVVDVE